MLKRKLASQTSPKRERVNINFNRKILGHATLTTLRDTLTTQGSVRGEAIAGVVDDLIKLRHLCENIVDAYNDGNTDNALQGIELLRLIV